MNFEMPGDIRREFRKAELAKYDRAYFTKEYWKEDLPGAVGNRSLSYDDPNHLERFRIIASAICKLSGFSDILDAGCGPGGLLNALASKSSARLVGVDASPAAVSIGLQDLGLGTRTKLVQAELIELPFADQEFDLVVCLDVLEHLPVFDIGDALRQIFRVSSDTVIFSINSDNPYKFHPTILSSETWRAILGSIGGWSRNHLFETALTQEVCTLRTEYDFYCYSKDARVPAKK
jgi:ubiquinone/menaquinone biosynthesis C-methylase UbiE